MNRGRKKGNAGEKEQEVFFSFLSLSTSTSSLSRFPSLFLSLSPFSPFSFCGESTSGLIKKTLTLKNSSQGGLGRQWFGFWGFCFPLSLSLSVISLSLLMVFLSLSLSLCPSLSLSISQ